MNAAVSKHILRIIFQKTNFNARAEGTKKLKGLKPILCSTSVTR